MIFPQVQYILQIMHMGCVSLCLLWLGIISPTSDPAMGHSYNCLGTSEVILKYIGK